MRLGDLTLTDVQAAALVRLLDAEAAAAECREAAERREAARAEDDCQIAARLRDRATRTAQLQGVIPGMLGYLQVDAAWRAFLAWEGWFAPSDLGHDLPDMDTPAWRECWELAYLQALDGLRHGRQSPVAVQEALRWQ